VNITNSMASFTLSWFASLCRAQPLRTRVLKEWASKHSKKWLAKLSDSARLAPFIGALLAVVVFRLLASGERDILTGKLFQVTHYRSVFMNVRMPSMPADGKLRQRDDRSNEYGG
jgi:hypothetical protein